MSDTKPTPEQCCMCGDPPKEGTIAIKGKTGFVICETCLTNAHHYMLETRVQRKLKGELAEDNRKLREQIAELEKRLFTVRIALDGPVRPD